MLKWKMYNIFKSQFSRLLILIVWDIGLPEGFLIATEYGNSITVNPCFLSLKMNYLLNFKLSDNYNT